MILYAAKHILPVASPPIPNGAVAVHDGRIVSVGRRRDVVKSHVGAELRDLGEVVVIPGLVNAHTHLELSWMNGEPPAGGSYMSWLRDLVARRPSIDETTAREAAAAALAAMMARGTVAVGDISNGTWAVPLLAASGVASIAFHEVFGFRAADAESILDAAAERLESMGAAVLTPHAAHTTSGPLLKALGGRAMAAGAMLTIHVAECAEEVQLLRDGTGPFREFLIERGAWDEGWKAPGLTPVEYLDRLGVLSPRTLAVHCVHVDHQDLTRLQARGVTVVTCPRSNRRLGVGTAPIPKLLASGIPIALGTDSLASSPDVDVFNEVAVLRQEHPGLAPAAALRIATLNGARALGLAASLGSIETGKSAALAVVALPESNDDPMEAVTWTSETVSGLLQAPWEAASR